VETQTFLLAIEEWPNAVFNALLFNFKTFGFEELTENNWTGFKLENF